MASAADCRGVDCELVQFENRLQGKQNRNIVIDQQDSPLHWSTSHQALEAASCTAAYRTGRIAVMNGIHSATSPLQASIEHDRVVKGKYVLP